MSVQISCFAHVVAEVSTIRSGLTELVARLDQLETWLSTAGDISADRRIMIEGQSELEMEPELQDAPPVDLTAATELNCVVLADTTNKALGEDAMEPAAEIAQDADSAETHSLLVAAQSDAALAAGTPDEAEILAAGATDLSGCASTVSHCQVAAAAESDGERRSAVMSSQANAALRQPDDDPVSVTPVTRMPDVQATLPAVVAAELADKAVCGDVVSPVDADAGVRDCEAQTKPPVEVSPALLMASPSTSLIVLPFPGAAKRSPSRPGGRRAVAAIAAGLIICVAAGAGYRLIDDRWAYTMRLAVDETVRSLPGLWQRAAAQGTADTQVMLKVSQD